MHNLIRFCPDNCKHLNITEKQQDTYKRKDISHICDKTGERILHGVYHPKLIQIEACKREILFRRFDR
jgi:hypothetical protein